MICGKPQTELFIAERKIISSEEAHEKEGMEVALGVQYNAHIQLVLTANHLHPQPLVFQANRRYYQGFA